MDIFPINDDNGLKIGFEIEVVYIWPKKIAKLLSKVDGVSNISCRKMFDSENEIHVEFDYFGEKFVVWEPYGDSSKYWILPKDKQPEKQIDISSIEAVFMEYEPPTIVKMLGGILSLKFMRVWKGGTKDGR